MQKNRLLSLVVIYVLISATFSFIPALAQSPGQPDIIQSILDESKSQFDQKRAQLVQDGITIPPSVDALYDDGLIEYNAALASLDSENLDEARDHAIEAMSLFEDATELLYESEQDFQSEQQAALNEIFELGETIANSESDADELRDLASENNLNVSFTDYDNAIATALEFLAVGNLDGARQQYEIAQNLLANIYDQIHDEASSNVDQRAQDYVENTIERINEIILSTDELGAGLPQPIIVQLQNIIEDLQNLQSTEEIINSSHESGGLNDLFTQNPDLIEAEEELEDAEEAIIDAQEEIDKATEKISKADEKGKEVSLSLTQLDAAIEKLGDAEAAFTSGNFVLAEELAKEAEDWASEARGKLIGKTLEDLEDETAEETGDETEETADETAEETGDETEETADEVQVELTEDVEISDEQEVEEETEEEEEGPGSA